METQLNSPLERTVRLNNGVFMPRLGLGVYQADKGFVTEQSVAWALEVGYRHIDTASFYGNEADVGHAIRKSGLARESIFITTKLWPTNFLRAEAAFEDSLSKLGLEYLDLYLIHWPLPVGRDLAWKVLQELYAKGRIKAIGVSNYSVKQLEALLRKSEIVPAVNQVEFSPFLYQKELLDYCQSKGIQLEAYSPLTRGTKLNDSTIETLAKQYNKSNAQIMIRWSLQHGLVVIPKTTKKERMIENMDVYDFEIDQQDMLRLDALNQNYSALFK